MSGLLEKIQRPADLRQLSMEQLVTLAAELRHRITQGVSQTGGHLASNLGVVELTIALHYVFDFSKDKLLWDVGHQCYAHKLLTGRQEGFAGLRNENGVSGFPNPAESPYDQFCVGHAGTSIATALGMALGAQHMGSSEKVVALVGDASIVNGLSFEALNNMGLLKRQMLVVLNDNSMAIDATQGAIAHFLSRVRLSHSYEEMRKRSHEMMEQMGPLGKSMEGAMERLKKSIRMTVSPSHLFEALNIPYFGPMDGHDLPSLIEMLKHMKDMPHPAILHVHTKKGQGFTPADADPSRFHSTGPFELNGDDVESQPKKRSFTDAFGDALIVQAKKDPRVVGITCAMAEGTGLKMFAAEFPGRFYDVGIAESVAVDIAAGMAKMGMRPVVCIYSTFMQRSFDQIFQEVSLQGLPVVFCVDRAGFVGGDGPTHHGLLDIGFFRMLPNIDVIAPSDEAELAKALEFALKSDRASAIRYPREPVMALGHEGPAFERGKCRVLRSSTKSRAAIVACGVMAARAMKAAAILEQEGIEVDVIDARFAKPIDPAIIELCRTKAVVTVEDHSLTCGFGSAVLEEAHKADAGQGKVRAITLGGPDSFVRHAGRDKQLDEAGVDTRHIAAAVRQAVAGA